MGQINTYLNTLFLTLLIIIPYGAWRNKTTQILIFVVIDLWLISNLAYGRTYYSMIPISSYGLAGNLSDFMPSVWSSLRWYDILFPLSTIFITGYYSRLKHSDPRNIKIYFATLGTTLLLATTVIMIRGGFRKSYERTLTPARHATVVQTHTLLGFIIYDCISSLSPITHEQKRHVYEWLDHKNAASSLIPDISPRRNLVLIICESLESWPIGQRLNGHEITPYLNSLTNDSTTSYCSHVMSQTKGGRSIDCPLLVTAGLIPPASGCYSVLYPRHEYHTLPKALKQDRNAKSLLLTTDSHNIWNLGPISRSMGIDSIIGKGHWDTTHQIRGRVSDESFLKQITERLTYDNLWPAGTPIYLQIVTYSGHMPFTIPEHLRGINTSTVNDTFLADYISAVNFLDRSLRPLIEYLKSRPDYDDTLIVITGDHEGLAEVRNRAINDPVGSKLVSSSQYVPLIIINSPVNISTDREIGQINIYPTLLQMLGLTGYKWKGVGRSIIDIVASDSVDSYGTAAEISDLIIKYDLLRDL